MVTELLAYPETTVVLVVLDGLSDWPSLDELDNQFECHQLASVTVVDGHQKLLGVSDMSGC